ncbi:MAG: MFS transporter [Candidatus Rokubacteria bacterium]|nr:MFS transporter [Candidatus Rokubacteria bacterium]
MSRDRGKVHFAWVVLGAVMLVMVTASGLRSVFGVFIKPLEAEFGWDRAALSGAAALSLFLLGAVGPFVGRLADRWGPRRVLALALLVLGIGTVASSFVGKLWHVYVASGILMAAGAGGAGLATASTVAARWFETRRGLVIGLLGGGMSAGQLVVVPVAMGLTLTFGWRQSYLWLGLGLLALILPLSIGLVRNDPREKGLTPYGAGHAVPSPGMTSLPAEARVSLTEAAQVPAFWLLVTTFFVCGYTSNGLVLTHLIPHSMEHGFSEMAAAQALGVMGAMNVMGTVASGWICDRFGRKGPLAFYYFVRGLSLLFLLYVWNIPSLQLFAAIFGLNYISTVPPTTTLTANIFGRYSVGELSGWIFFSHQVGAALGAALGGWIFDWTGSYAWAFLSAAVLAVLAAGLSLMIREEPATRRPTPAAGVPVPTET